MTLVALPSVPAAAHTSNPDVPGPAPVQPEKGGRAERIIRLILEGLGFLALAGLPFLLMAVPGMHALAVVPFILLALLVTGNLALGAIAYRGAGLLESLPRSGRAWIAYGCTVAALALHFVWTFAISGALEQPAEAMVRLFGASQAYLILLGLPGFVVGWKKANSRRGPDGGATG